MTHRTLTRAVARTFALLVLALAAPMSAADEHNLPNGITAEGAPLALRGFDPVAYHTLGVPTQGAAEHTVVHEDVAYYFASEENARAFEKKPARYVPAYGGFCAFGVSVGKKFDGDPRYWQIHEGRLYLNLNRDIAREFKKDVPGAVAKAERQWSRIAHTPVSDL